jgi:hypothetical protein
MKRKAAEILKEAMALAVEARAALAALLGSFDQCSEMRGRLFARARHRALKRLRAGLDLQWTPAASRDDLHRR